MKQNEKVRLIFRPCPATFYNKTAKRRTVPVVTKPADIKALGDTAARSYALEELARGLYALCLPRPVLPAELAALPPVMR